MTPGDSSFLFPQRRENERSPGIVGPSSLLGPPDYQGRLTPGVAENEFVETEQFEDDQILGQLQTPPQFGKETRVLCMTRLNDIPEETTIEFGLVDTDLDNISLWLRAPENVQCVGILLPLCILILRVLRFSLDFSQARCISLVCNSIQDLEPHAIEQGESRKHGFDVFRPVPWTKVPPVSFLMNDEFTFMFPLHEARSVTFSELKPLTTIPVKASEHLFDISPYVRLGQNKLRFSQVDSMSDYVLVLYSHYPTESQIAPLRARWDERKRFMEQLAHLVRPIPPPPNRW